MSIATSSVRPLALLAAAALAACGGGGGDAPAAPRQPNANAPRVVVSADNAALLAGFALQANAQGIGVVGDGRGFANNANAGANAKTHAFAARKTSSSLRLLAAAAPATKVTNCGISGTLTDTNTVADPNTATVGDTDVQVFDHCSDDGVTQTNGTINDLLTNLQPNGADGRGRADHQLTVSLSTSVDTVTDRLDAKLAESLSVDQAQTELQSTFTGELTEEHIVNGASHAFLRVSAINYSARFPVATGQWIQNPSFTGSGTFSGLGDVSFEFTTLESLVLENTDTAPSAGKFRITGANNATVTVTIQGTNATIEIDANGDGTVDATQTKTLDEIAALL